MCSIAKGQPIPCMAAGMVCRAELNDLEVFFFFLGADCCCWLDLCERSCGHVTYRHPHKRLVFRGRCTAAVSVYSASTVFLLGSACDAHLDGVSIHFYDYDYDSIVSSNSCYIANELKHF